MSEEYPSDSKSRMPRMATRLSLLLPNLAPLRLISAWKECAGPALLKQTRFHGIQVEDGKKVLRLDVPDPVWRQELEFQRTEILERFRSILRTKGFAEADLPVECSFGAKGSMPLKSVGAKKGRNK